MGAAEADQLITFQVHGLRQEQIGEVIGLIQRVRKRHHEGELGHGLPEAAGLGKGNGRIAFIDKPYIGGFRLRPRSRGPALQAHPCQG